MKWLCISFFAIGAFPSGLALVWHFLVTEIGQVKKFSIRTIFAATQVICQIAVALTAWQIQILPRDREERKERTGFCFKSHRSKILNCIIIYKL